MSAPDPTLLPRAFKLLVEYDGTEYAGWQRQNNGPTIQAAIEDALLRLLGVSVTIAGSGRTDAGVHALGQVASFQAATRLIPGEICGALNAFLSRDITILEVAEVDDAFHARISAVSKLYRYRILNREVRSSLDRHRCLLVNRPLDLVAMRTAAKGLLGRQDFRAFACKVLREKSCIRTIKCVDILREGEYILVEVEADGFLQRMVRTVVGTLIEIGLDRLRPSVIQELIQSGNRSNAGPTVPAQGLFLVRVEYEYPNR